MHFSEGSVADFSEHFVAELVVGARGLETQFPCIEKGTSIAAAIFHVTSQC